MVTVRHLGKVNVELRRAAEGSNLSAVEKALADGAQVNKTSQFDKMTALHLAAGNGNEEMVDLLLTHGADVGVLDDYGRTPSVVAIECGFYELADRLTDLECRNIEKKTQALADQSKKELRE